MNDLDKNTKEFSSEQKKGLFKKLLQNKITDGSHQRKKVPERFYNFELFKEYKELKQGDANLKRFKIANPFFKPNETFANNTTIIGGTEYISYSGYNYLGFCGDPRVSDAVKQAIDHYGTSVSASRIVTGERPIHGELEKEIADLLGTEDCIAFVSGYGTNVTTIGHLFGPKDLVLHDALIHASILKGCMLSGAKRIPFPHNDCKALDAILQENRHNYERVLIVIEGVYSMDGDIADLPGFIELRNKYKTILMVDEAHSIGVLGKTGRGLGEYFDVNRKDVDLWMGTLSKTFASCGGYIATSKPMVDVLKYTAPGFLYSVGMSPPNAAAALASARLLKKEPERVSRLHHNSKFFLNLAKELGLNTGLSKDSAVIPIIIGDSLKSLIVVDKLFKKGINVHPIFYPAVAEDAARLRFFITSEHTEEQMRYTLKEVREVIKSETGNYYRRFIRFGS